MKRKFEAAGAMLATTAWLLFAGTGLLAAEPGVLKGNLFDIYFAEDIITMEAAGQFEQALVRVTGPQGFVFEQTYHGSEVPHFEAMDAEGNALPNGQYTYEVRIRPFVSDSTRAAMKRARGNGDGTMIMDSEKTGSSMVQSGYFRIVNGQVLIPSFDEQSATLAKTDTGRDNNAQPGTATSDPGDEPGTQDAGSTDRDNPEDGDVPSTRDQVIFDDLIVQQSICVGQDCTNGESFGFDTLRLKENNLRIKFQDTSNSASFPTNDWQLTANDSTNGGANKFSIDDIDGGRTPFTIEASAPSHSLYVDNGGRIGLGTSAPVVELHIPNGDTPTVRLEQDGTSGFTPQTWDVAGNETNFFVRDATNGSRLPFKIRPSAPTNSIFVDTDGDVGFGTASPSAGLDIIGELEVNSNDGFGHALTVIETTANSGGVGDELVQFTNNGPVRIAIENTAATDEWIISNSTGLRFDHNAGSLEFRFRENGNFEALGGVSIGQPPGSIAVPSGNFLATGSAEISGGLLVGPHPASVNPVIGEINATGNVMANGVILTSDRNLKENFEMIDTQEILEKVSELPITTWNFIKDEEKVRHIGPMAQDFHESFGYGGTETRISILDSASIALASIQALNQKLETKQKEINDLQAKLSQLETLEQQNRDMAEKLNKLEAMMNQLTRQQQD